jgi:uncharacterized Fe-S cluster protein YjdI
MENKRTFSGGRRYTNGEITVYWKPDACIHASHCYRELIEVFDPGRRPWVDMYGATTEQIIETVNLCPTEALTWKWNDEEKNKDIDKSQTNHVIYRRPDLVAAKDEEEKPRPVTIKVMPDGPLVISGTFTVHYSGNKKEVNESLTSLCRCGATNHHPFCDGTHRKSGFTDN